MNKVTSQFHAQILNKLTLEMFERIVNLKNILGLFFEQFEIFFVQLLRDKTDYFNN